MKPSMAKAAVKALYATRRSTIFWGPPGVGKSGIMSQAAEELGVGYLDVRLPYHDPGDLRFPLVDLKKGTMQFVCPLFPRDPNWRGLICLEEVAQAAAMTQAAAMQIALERRIGDQKLPEGAMVVACSNRVEDRAGAGRLLTALSNRFVHIDVEVDANEWQQWAIQAAVHHSVRAYLAWKPSELHRFRPELNEREFPSPRSWEFASDTLKVMPAELRHETISGCVGKGAAAEFISFLEIEEKLTRDYPLEKILSDPTGCPLPTRSEGSVMFALCGILAEKARAKVRAQTQACVKYAMRLPIEFATYAIRGLVSLGGTLDVMGTPGASDFIGKHAHIMLAK